MQILEYLSILRRRWFYIALGAIVGLIAGFVTAPGVSNEAEEYQATHQLLINQNSASAQVMNLGQTVLVVTEGAVPERVATRLEAAGEPAFTGVSAEADIDLRSLGITAYSTTPEGAAAAADLFAEELNADLMGIDQLAYEEGLQQAEDLLTTARQALTAADEALAQAGPEDPARESLESQRALAAARVTEAEAAVREIESQGDVEPPLRTLEAATGGPVAVEGWRIPESKPSRALLLGMFGALLGVAGAIGADRLDTRVRRKEDAERAFDLPVIAEIPPLPSGTKSRELLVATRPAAPFVEACRALRTVVLFATSTSGGAEPKAPAVNGSESASAALTTRAHVILITSPSAGEGKTTTAAHLAATLAEFGKKVLVVSADFRRPRIHELFGVEREPGLSDVLDSGNARVRLSDIQMSTNFSGVHLLPSGGPVNNPAQLLTETSHLISAARELFDFIVIDTPPLLVANDATELAAIADLVILMAKADRTSRESARRTTEILRRVDAPLLGVVVASAHDTPTAYGYYRYRYYADADHDSGGRRNRKAGRSASDDRHAAVVPASK